MPYIQFIDYAGTDQITLNLWEPPKPKKKLDKKKLRRLMWRLK